MKVSRESTIELNGLTWTISEVDEVPNQSKDEEMVGMGRCYTATLHVYVKDDLPKDNFVRTLSHELTHAMFYSYGFDQVTFNQEVACDFMATYADMISRMITLYMVNRNKQK